MTTTPITTAAMPEAASTSRTRAFQIAWGLAMCFYFLEYASRSAPAVMIPELTRAFGTTALGVSAILGTYYYTYSVASLIAGGALDRVGAKKAVPIGIFILAVGCLVFSIPTTTAVWYVAPGKPKNARLSMVYVGLRYVLPTTSGTLAKVPRPD
jgi:fucose permease